MNKYVIAPVEDLLQVFATTLNVILLHLLVLFLSCNPQILLMFYD